MTDRDREAYQHDKPHVIRNPDDQLGRIDPDVWWENCRQLDVAKQRQESARRQTKRFVLREFAKAAAVAITAALLVFGILAVGILFATSLL